METKSLKLKDAQGGIFFVFIIFFLGVYLIVSLSGKAAISDNEQHLSYLDALRECQKRIIDISPIQAKFDFGDIDDISHRRVNKNSWRLTSRYIEVVEGARPITSTYVCVAKYKDESVDWDVSLSFK